MLSRAKRFFFSGFFIANAIALSGTAVFMFLSYLYHFAMVRMLEPALYGQLGVLIGFVSILLMPAQSIQTVIAREIAKLDSQKKFAEGFAVTRSYMRSAFLFGAAFALAGIALLEALKPFFKSELVFLIQLILLFIPVWYVLYVARGFLQGKEWILAVSSVNALEPFLKVLFAVLLVYLGYGLLGAAVSIEFASLIILLPIAFYFLLRHRGAKPAPIRFGESFKPVLATNVLLMLFLYLDLFAVNFLKGSEEAAYYNVAGITSRILYFIAGGLILVLLPKSSKLHLGQAREIGSLLLKTIAFLVPAFLIFMLFPQQFIFFFYTPMYYPAVLPFAVLSIGLFLFSCFYLVVNLLWSQHRERFPLFLSCAAILLDALLLFLLIPPYGMLGAAISTTATSALLFLAGVSYLFLRLNPGAQGKTAPA